MVNQKTPRVRLTSIGLSSSNGIIAEDIPYDQVRVTVRAQTPTGQDLNIGVHTQTVLRYYQMLGSYALAWNLFSFYAKKRLLGVKLSSTPWTAYFDEMADILEELGQFPPALRKALKAPSTRLGPTVRPLCSGLATELAPWRSAKGGLRRRRLFASVVHGPRNSTCKLTGREPGWLQNPNVPKFCSFRASVPPHIQAWMKELYGIESALRTTRYSATRG